MQRLRHLEDAPRTTGSMSLTVVGERCCVRHNQSESNGRCRNRSLNWPLRLEMQKNDKTLNVVQNAAAAAPGGRLQPALLRERRQLR